MRIVASTRADIYDAVLAALGTIAGPLHGGASRLAYSLLVEAERFGAERARDDAPYLEELGERPLRYRARAVYASGRQ